MWKLEEAVAAAGNDLDGSLGRDPATITLDCDSTGVEVFGPSKQGTGWNYEGVRGYQPFTIFWAERRRAVASDLLAGNQNPVSRAPRLLDRALRYLPEQPTEIRLRADSGFYSAPLMQKCRRRGVRFSISAKRWARKPFALADWQREMPFIAGRRRGTSCRPSPLLPRRDRAR